jgi:hypothetical protein
MTPPCIQRMTYEFPCELNGTCVGEHKAAADNNVRVEPDVAVQDAPG